MPYYSFSLRPISRRILRPKGKCKSNSLPIGKGHSWWYRAMFPPPCIPMKPQLAYFIAWPKCMAARRLISRANRCMPRLFLETDGKRMNEWREGRRMRLARLVFQVLRACFTNRANNQVFPWQGCVCAWFPLSLFFPLCLFVSFVLRISLPFSSSHFIINFFFFTIFIAFSTTSFRFSSISVSYEVHGAYRMETVLRKPIHLGIYPQCGICVQLLETPESIQVRKYWRFPSILGYFSAPLQR